MNEVERVNSMLAEGKITAEEAERLIAVLEEVEGVQRELEAVGNAAESAAESAAAQAPALAQTPKAAQTLSAEDERWPGSGRWVRVSMLAGDLDVRLDESLSTPQVRSDDGTETDLEVLPDGEGYRISQFGGGGDLLNRLVAGFRRSDLELRLPPGHYLHLDVKAGDVAVHDVPYLKGSLLAGDLEARGLQGVDLKMQAGDLDLELRPTSGRHRVHVSAGDVTVRLLEGSSTQVRGRVSIGEIQVAGDASSDRSGLGASLSATVGGGDADLDLRLSTGQLTLKVHDE